MDVQIHLPACTLSDPSWHHQTGILLEHILLLQDKTQQIEMLRAKGYNFIVLPDAFVIHRPHGKSGAKIQFDAENASKPSSGAAVNSSPALNINRVNLQMCDIILSQSRN